jgi:hypothetical protein
MKRTIKTILFVIFFGLAIVSVQPVKAQCSQCSAQVATNSKNGGKAANGLNKGILFLLAAPYLAVAAIGFLWYKKFRHKNTNTNMPDEKMHFQKVATEQQMD